MIISSVIRILSGQGSMIAFLIIAVLINICYTLCTMPMSLALNEKRDDNHES